MAFTRGKSLQLNLKTAETGVEVMSIEEASTVLKDKGFCSPLLLSGSEWPSQPPTCEDLRVP